MDPSKRKESLPVPSALCTPVSIIKTKRLRKTDENSENRIFIQFFTPDTRPSESKTALSTDSKNSSNKKTQD